MYGFSFLLRIRKPEVEHSTSPRQNGASVWASVCGNSSSAPLARRRQPRINANLRSLSTSQNIYKHQILFKLLISMELIMSLKVDSPFASLYREINYPLDRVPASPEYYPVYRNSVWDSRSPSLYRERNHQRHMAPASPEHYLINWRSCYGGRHRKLGWDSLSQEERHREILHKRR